VPAPDTLRVLDFGRADALRSQTLWHAVAYGVSAGSPPTLSFVRPAEPYVCIGYHRRLDEVDIDACRARGLPVLRRMVGGGPVYLDDGQLFFQIALPVAAVSPSRTRALRELLEPAVAAFRSVGVPADLDANLEVVVGDQKVCGHGAGQIDDAVVVVGNLIERFDHAAAAAVLRVPRPEARVELTRLMRRYVAATPADADAFRDAAIDAYAAACALRATRGRLSALEHERLVELDRRFQDPAWVIGPDRPASGVWQVKVRAGVWVLAAEHAGASVVAGVAGGRIEHVSVADAELNGAASRLEQTLVGHRLDDAAALLGGFGPPGERVAAALARADASRL
jgi:lipoate-protein ligase A